MSARIRFAILAGIVLIVLVATGGYVLRVQQRQAKAGSVPTAPRADLATVTAQPHLVFRNTALGDGFGRILHPRCRRASGRHAHAPQRSADRVCRRRGDR